jgi:RNA polymerase sigma factor (sigma-70 family)
LEQWLYQLTDRVLQSYIQRRKSIDARRRSLETLTKVELRSLEEQITADADAEPWLVEDLDDAEIEQREFRPPANTESNPEQKLEREEEVDMVFRALSKLPERDRAIFDLVMVEGFSEEVVSRMYRIPRGEVLQVVERVREKIRRDAAAVSQGTAKKEPTNVPAQKKAS